MSCFYASVFNLNDWSVVKYGISRENEPWARIVAMGKSRDNPFYERIDPHCFFFVRLPYRGCAFAVETALKRYAVDALPRVHPHLRPSELALPGTRDNTPSGEWLAHPGSQWEAAASFYSLAQAALADRGDGPYSGLMAQAYERIYRAAVGFHAGEPFFESLIAQRHEKRGWRFEAVFV